MDQPITREVFSDKKSSWINFLLGFLADMHPVIIPAFLYYQLFISETNAPIDITEFASGWAFKEMMNKNK